MMTKAREKNVDRISGISNSLSSPEFLVYHYFQNDLIDSINKYAGGKLLDIGCGNKPYASVVNQKVESYTGCDIVQSSNNCVDVICEATSIPLINDSFDTVLSTQTIEHVEDHQQLVNEAFRLLKDGGYFILSGPMYWPLHEEPYDFFRFTKHGFSYILNKAGFDVVEIKSNGGKWALCGQVIMQTLFPEIRRSKRMKWRILRMFFNLAGGVKGLNKFFLRMDNGSKNEVTTLNYVVVAKKNSSTK
jgi:SAM-dependent methyltransferase